jgi:hypothetical protein
MISALREKGNFNKLLDEPWGEQNPSLANTLSDTRPDPERHIASDKSRKAWLMPLRGSPPLAISHLDKRVQRRFDVILQEHSYRR